MRKISLCLRGVPVLMAFVFLPLLAASGETGNQPILLSPESVGPGDILLITVAGRSDGVTGEFNGKPVHFNPSSGSMTALVGLDLNMKPGVYPLSVTMDGETRVRKVRVGKKEYPLQRLTLPKDKVTLSPENEARVDRELKLISAIWPVDSLRMWSGRFQDPLPGKELGTPFGVRRIINDIPKNSHSGVDVSGDEGDPVLAPNDGVAVLVDEHFYGGNSLVLDHGQGIYTMFFHLSKINVRPGQAVLKGEVVALVGSTGRSTGAHLHWGVRMQGARVDPLQLIGLKLEEVRQGGVSREE